MNMQRDFLVGSTTQREASAPVEYCPPKDYVKGQFALQGLTFCVQIMNRPDEIDFTSWLWENQIFAWSRVFYSDGVCLFGFNEYTVAVDFKIRFG